MDVTPFHYPYAEFQDHWDRYVFCWSDNTENPLARARRDFRAKYRDPKEAEWKSAVFERIVRYYVKNVATFDEGYLLEVGENTFMRDRLLRALHYNFLKHRTGVPDAREISNWLHGKEVVLV